MYKTFMIDFRRMQSHNNEEQLYDTNLLVNIHEEIKECQQH